MFRSKANIPFAKTQWKVINMLSVFEFILNLSLPEFISDFYVAVIKYPDKRNLGKKNIHLFIDFDYQRD